MLPANISNRIHFIARPDMDVRSGDFIFVHVLKRLVGKKWAIGFRGQVFSAVSDVELTPGERILTQVFRSGRRFVLYIKDSPRGAQSELLQRLNTGTGGLPALLVQSLLRSKINLNGALLARIGRTYQDLRSKYMKREVRIARGLAVLLDKKMDISSEGLDSIIRIIALLPEGEKDGRRRDHWSRDFSDMKELLKKISDRRKEGDEEGSPLQLFNHLKGLNESWIVIPYHFRTEGETYSGLIKILLENYHHVVKRLVLDVRSGDELWSFIIKTDKNKRKLSLFCNSSGLRKKGRKKISSLSSKLQNHGVECDDSIYDEEIFDGFSLPGTNDVYQSIDTFT